MNLSSLDSQRLMLSWPGVLVFALATWGILAKPSRLDSRRPVESRPTSAPASKSGEIPSRLWDSPFSSLPPAKTPLLNGGETQSSTFGEQFALQLRQLKVVHCRQFVVAAVCMPPHHGSPEDMEQARRRRWATVSALHASGAIPLHADRIEMAEIAHSVREATGEVRIELSVPTEWFAVPGRSASADTPVCEQLVAVLWIDEATLGDAPLDRLSLLMDALKSEIDAASSMSSEPPLFTIIGPLTSNMLVSFAENWKSRQIVSTPWPQRRSRSWPWRTLFINTDATSTRARTQIDEAVREGTDGDSLATLDEPPSTAPSFVHTIGTDADLAKRVVRELELRNSFTDRASVALLAEWDTEYGRDVLTTFRAAFEKQTLHQESRLWEFTFPRGLDGTPVAMPGNTKDPQSDTILESASGAPQLDYLRRLVKRLKERPSDEPPLRAIGILASDVYDKLLLLRALRDEFPNVVIFTTDLDQRLLHPAEAQWNHNLVIVSHFDSQLSAGLQRSVAPFRDSYQTSLFLGVRLAVDSATPAWVDGSNSSFPATRSSRPSVLPELIDPTNDEGSPRRLRSISVLTYEVSNQGAYRLGWSTDPVHPVKPTLGLVSGLRQTLLSLVAGVLFLLFVAPLSGVLRDILFWPWRRFVFRYHHGLVLFALCAVVPLSLVVFLSHSSEEGEPFAAFAGISIWPTIYLRLFLLCVCMYFLFSHQEDHDELTRRVSDECFATIVPPRSSHLRSINAKTLLANAILSWRDFGGVARSAGSSSAGPSPPSNERGSGVELWCEYIERSTWLARHARVLPHLGTALLVGIALFALHGLAQPPIRGFASRYASITSYFISGAVALWLLLMVLDSVRLCKRWIELLNEDDAPLPPEAIARATQRLHATSDGTEVPAHRSAWLGSFQRFRAASTLANSIVRTTYAPFVVIAISFIARHNIFDNWEWNAPMMVMYGFAVAIAIYTVFTFGGVVRSYKEHVLDQLRNAKGVPRLADDDVKSLEALIKEVEETTGSALAPLQKNPIVAVALMPAGSVGVLSLIEQLAPVFIH